MKTKDTWCLADMDNQQYVDDTNLGDWAHYFFTMSKNILFSYRSVGCKKFSGSGSTVIKIIYYSVNEVGKKSRDMSKALWEDPYVGML